MRESIFAVPGRISLALIFVSSFVISTVAEEPLPRKKPQTAATKNNQQRNSTRQKRRRVSPATFYEVHGPYPMDWPVELIEMERANCRNILNSLKFTYKLADPIGSPDHCGNPAPIEVSSIAGTKIHPPATLNCQFAARIHSWVKNKVQPAARKHFGKPISTLTNVSSYTCRRRRGGVSKRMSEHSYANALDISAFTLMGGDKISVEDEWGSGIFDRSRSRFLEASHAGGCKIISTVLGPDYNAAHANHLHMDFARDGRGGICR